VILEVPVKLLLTSGGVTWLRAADVLLADAQRWAADIAAPAYAIDEQTAITVLDGTATVVSEGKWTKFES
jgi:hypothetical protein